ncbi:MAG: hypothetical protein Q8J69_06395 [Sphingobacteriaceae bacterium]|nr:hypothetical protein [Sphingobacteriaceae bacterium]
MCIRKAILRSLCVMLILWMLSLLVYYWPLPEEVVRVLPMQKKGVPWSCEGCAPEQRVRVLPVD